ncbi:TetR/AcrR family transcriptional regulator [Hydrogenimonas sp.]
MLQSVRAITLKEGFIGTKERILEAALALFNEKETQSATTNHIAKAAGVSPGNLYYHFKNKECIIRHLYRRMTEEVGFETRPLPESMCELKSYCSFVAGVWWKYRFFRRESLFLMRRDPELARMVAADNRAWHGKLLSLIEHLRQKGYLLLPADDAYEALADTIMLYSQFWVPYLTSLGNEVDEAAARMVTERIFGLFGPYLSEMAEEELAYCRE